MSRPEEGHCKRHCSPVCCCCKPTVPPTVRTYSKGNCVLDHRWLPWAIHFPIPFTVRSQVFYSEKYIYCNTTHPVSLAAASDILCLPLWVCLIWYPVFFLLNYTVCVCAHVCIHIRYIHTYVTYIPCTCAHDAYTYFVTEACSKLQHLGFCNPTPWWYPKRHLTLRHH